MRPSRDTGRTSAAGFNNHENKDLPDMEADVSRQQLDSSLAAELYFLIVKFLADGPCRAVADALKSELERTMILPQRLDWQGNSHRQSFEELERKYSHISPQHLLQICARIGPVLEKEVPPCVAGAISLLGAGKQSLLRTKEDMMRFFRNISGYSARSGGKPFINPPGYFPTHNMIKILQGRENSGPLSRREAVPTSFYKKIQLYRHTLGHLSAVYCVLYDRTGKYIITGADDLLVKVWSSTDGRLLATFRGASSEIMDIAVNFDNTLLAAGSLDRILRIWCFQTMSPIAVLSGHSGMITSVNFCPTVVNGVNYLVSTSSDGSVAFWSHTQPRNERAVFQPKPIQYHEKMRPGQAQMICASFSPGGAFMAAGSADHHVRVYMMLGEEGPRRVLEVEAHSDTVDSIQWAHSGLRFISGSKDGTANVWNFKQQQWQHMVLIMHTKLPGDVEPDDDSNKKTKVTMVCWDVSDEWVVTAVNDGSLKVWNSKTAELVKVLRAHKDEVFVLESHPVDPRVILSAGHDGQLIIWDVLNTEPIACFQNFIEGQGNGAVFDAKWSPDGTMLAATDSHGHLMMYGFGSGVGKLKIVPKELFFHTDYRPLIRDANNYVLDEQTQTAPHLMPPPFLVDVDGNPYPPALQRLVPGRENCRGEQLVPNIAVGASGQQEVIDGLPAAPNGPPRSNIDRLIEALAQRQLANAENADGNADIDIEGDGNDEHQQHLQYNEEQSVRHMASPRSSRAGPRRVGDIVGVRQSSGNWQRDNTTPWNKPILVRPLNQALLETQYTQITAMAEAEMDCYKREMHRRPQETNSAATPDQGRVTRNKKSRTARHGYRTRATRDEEQEDEEFENPDNSGSSGTSNESSSNEEELCSDSSTSDTSSEYSDWIADHGENLEPPKRSKRKPVQKRAATPLSDTDNSRRRSQRPKKKTIPIMERIPNSVTEVPEVYRPSEWLSEVIPRKAPYYPQMGDEIVYFRQGHKRYLDVVRDKKIYGASLSLEPWTKLDLKAQEFVKVIGIKYEIRPPRLCCLKLAQMNEEGHLTGVTFTIKYHDIPDVLDFLVLRQTFDNALDRTWSEGNRFRCMIDDGWWTGQIISVQPLSEEFPDSYFMCFNIRWDSGETEFMSPWDLEPIDEERLPTEIGGAVPVLSQEILNTLYQPQADEWPMGDRDAVCDRIIHGLDQVMTLAIAEPFNVPVDLNVYPLYAYVVEYPIDLSTIKARFENRFYRRITSAQFDVRYLATNAEKFNERHSQIVKQARIITDICLKIIKDITEHDVTSLYHELVDAYQSSEESDVDVEDDIHRPSTSSQRPTRSTSNRNNRVQKEPTDWRVACRQLLDTLWQCQDSNPFREPVDRLEHPDYYQVIDTPMDLRTVKEDLLGGNYDTPMEFAKDVKLIFTNSKNYNTNPRSKIYSMTVRLSAMFDELIRKIINRWKSATRNRDNKSKNKSKSNTKSKSKSKSKKGSSSKNSFTNGAESLLPSKGPSRKRQLSSDDDTEDEDDNEVPVENDDDDEDDQSEAFVPLKKPCKSRHVNHDEAGPSTLENGHSTRLNSSRPSLRPRNPKRKLNNSDDDDDDDEEHSDGSSASLRESSDDSTPKPRTRSRKLATTTMMNGHDDSDSDEAYEPSPKGKQTRNNRAKNSKKTRPNRTPVKRYTVDNDDDDEDEEDEEDEEQEQYENENDDDQYVAEQSDESEELMTRSRRKQKAAAIKNNINDSSSEEEEEQENDEENNENEESQDDDDVDNELPQAETEDGQQEVEGDDEEHEENVEIEENSDDDEDDENDDDDDDDEDDESTENHQVLSNVIPTRDTGQHQVRKLRVSRDSESSNGINPKHHLRSSAASKRMRYTEDTDDEDEDDDDDSLDSGAPSAKRRRAVKRPYYGEASDEETNSSQPGSGVGTRRQDSGGLGISVSSRGRVRKMTPKAMSALR